MNLLTIILISSLASFAISWDPVAPGIDFQHVRYLNKNEIFIVRTDRTNPTVIIDTMVAGERIKGSREHTTTMYKRYHESLTAWNKNQLDGTRIKAAAAVNGYYFGMSKGTWISGGIANGWYVHKFDNMQAKAGHASGYAVKQNGTIFIGECVDHPHVKNHVHVPLKNIKVNIRAINVEEGEDTLVIFTPQFDIKTPPNIHGLDIVIEFASSVGLHGDSNMIVGTVVTVNKDKNGSIIPFDTIVLAAKGLAANALSSVVAGDKVEIHQDMVMYDMATCKNPIHGKNWAGSFSGLGLDTYHIKEGKRIIYKDTQRHPRTSMAFNDKHIFFYVVDGRSSRSQGMTIDELSEFALNYLKATEAGALDGGGSSTMVVDGKIKNSPSDGSERTVTNAVIFGNTVVKQFSQKYKPNQAVVTIASVDLYAGPGTNYHVIHSDKQNVAGSIMAHRLSGVKAKDNYWWKVHLGNSLGWIMESKLK